MRCAWTQTRIAAPTVTPMMRRPPPCARNSSMTPDAAMANHVCGVKPRRAISSAVRLGMHVAEYCI